MKLNKILVPLDGSTLAEAALRKAVDLAAEVPGREVQLPREIGQRPVPGRVGLHHPHRVDDRRMGVLAAFLGCRDGSRDAAEIQRQPADDLAPVPAQRLVP